MRHHPHRWPLLLLPVVLAGCSSTAGSRFGGTPQSRSIAVVGDRPLPATTGEPGGQVAADVPEPEPRRNPKARISGRVVDDQGRPVPDVTVRLADGGVKGGKDVRVTTDRAGGFTLGGLRPGSTYWLIAESEDDRGPLTGRVQATTSETGVEITLAGQDDEAGDPGRKTGRTTRARPISNRQTPADEPAEGVNGEDVGSPGPDEAPLDPGPPPKAKAGRPRLSAPEPTVGWHGADSSRNARESGPEVPEGIASSSDAPARPRSVPADQPSPEDEEEGPNPLPPAIDPGPSDQPATPSVRSNARRKVGPRAPARSTDPGEMAPAPEARFQGKPGATRNLPADDAEAVVASAPLAMPPLEPDPVSPLDRPPMAVATAGPVPPPSTGPLDMPPIGDAPVASLAPPDPKPSPPAGPAVSQVVTPSHPAPRPVFASPAPAPNPDPSAEYNPFVLVSATPPAPEPVAEEPPALPAPIPPPSPAAPAPAPAVKKKWGEVAGEDRPIVAVEPTRATPVSLLKRFRTPPAEGRAPSVASCSYDPKMRRIEDFRLPDLDGKPVSFKDLDADYVLLDFWGTWCGPCLEAIPHLIALQKKYGPSRLRVVGIACEQVPPDQRKARVDAASRQQGINYAILLSGMDGKPCPVQKALQIQYYPTTILVDRKGQVVWRDAGTTPAGRDRLERVLASSLGRGETVRR